MDNKVHSPHSTLQNGGIWIRCRKCIKTNNVDNIDTIHSSNNNKINEVHKLLEEILGWGCMSNEYRKCI